QILFIFLLAEATRAMRLQSAGVEGQLMCGMKPAVGVHVKLWEEDSGPDPDDVLDEGYTDANGRFSLKGSERELTPIDPVFKVYHDCDDFLVRYRTQRFHSRPHFSPERERSSSRFPTATSRMAPSRRGCSPLEFSISRPFSPRRREISS
ncbi:hypothetical protein PMAYCL1PPCAC_28720, partial [Pristionchus mayeri]